MTDRDFYRHWTTDTVRFSDQDGTGHVNNVAVAAYVETGRLAFMREVVRLDRDQGESGILAKLTIDYLSESYWPGKVDIGSRLVRIGGKSFTVGSGLFRDGQCIATSESVLVYLKDRKSAPIAGALRERLEKLLAE
ncbi:MAG: acyl-CoA thioesterase [Minwuiales bacterium]|nr:acyl-CoA thioesterase [Minwuiales bacterium]